jgi:DNA-binding beta-propeller fold protein YncE
MQQPAASVEAPGNALRDPQCNELSSPEESATHALVHTSGIILVCGVRRQFIRVLQPNGQFKCDMSLTCVGQPLPVRNLAATAVDLSNGNIYVCDSEAGAVYCISDEGVVLASSPAGAVTQPLGLSLCAHSRRLAVADTTSVRILHADGLALIKTIAYVHGAGGCTPLSHCKSVAFDADGFLYVVDSGSDRVIVFDCFYVSIHSFGGHGSYHGQFYGAHGICIDSTGKVFVSDSTRVQMFTRSGLPILSLVPALLDPQLAWSQLAGISLDDRGRLLVCSQGTRSLLRIL